MAENNSLIRKLPYSFEAEQAVLCCILISENAMNMVTGRLNIEAFYSSAHKTIYESMVKIYSSNKPVDLITLTSELEKIGKLSEIGDIDYLTTLSTIVPSASNIDYYINIVKQCYIMRALVDAGEKIAQIGYGEDEYKEALQKAEKIIFDIGDKQNISELTHISEPLEVVRKKFEDIAVNPDALRGIPTGFYRLDKLTNGLQKGDLILIAARPGVGKTSLTMNIVANAAINSGAKCAVFSLEMPKAQIAQRCLCSTAFVDMSKGLSGDLSVDDWQALLEAKKKLCDTHIYIDDSSMTTYMDILAKCRKLKREKGLDLIMIDYLQLMNSPKTGGKDNRQQEISDITRNLKIAAKELNVPILLLSQLSRGVEARTDHKPMLADLRESGAIEQDADIVMFIYNPDNYLTDEGAVKQNIVDLIVAKHRNGATDTIKLKFLKQHTTFVNLSQDAEAQSLEQSAPMPNEAPPVQNNENSGDMSLKPIDDDDIFF